MQHEAVSLVEAWLSKTWCWHFVDKKWFCDLIFGINLVVKRRVENALFGLPMPTYVSIFNESLRKHYIGHSKAFHLFLDFMSHVQNSNLESCRNPTLYATKVAKDLATHFSSITVTIPAKDIKRHRRFNVCLDHKGFRRIGTKYMKSLTCGPSLLGQISVWCACNDPGPSYVSFLKRGEKCEYYLLTKWFRGEERDSPSL
jgi:hypothetical protein